MPTTANKVLLHSVRSGKIIPIHPETEVSQVLVEDGRLDTYLSTLHSIATSAGVIAVVDELSGRDAIVEPRIGYFCFVKDASNDPEVASGFALYIYQDALHGWVRVVDASVLDIVLSWAKLIDKPQSTVENIDDAVIKKHAHENAALLDNFSEDDSGTLLFKGRLVEGTKEICVVNAGDTIPIDFTSGIIIEKLV